MSLDFMRLHYSPEYQIMRGVKGAVYGSLLAMALMYGSHFCGKQAKALDEVTKELDSVQRTLHIPAKDPVLPDGSRINNIPSPSPSNRSDLEMSLRQSQKLVSDTATALITAQKWLLGLSYFFFGFVVARIVRVVRLVKEYL